MTRSCQLVHHPQIPLVVPWAVNRRLADERDSTELGMSHDARKGLRADPAFADMLLPVSPRREGGLRIVRLNHPHIAGGHSRGELLQRLRQAFLSVDRISRLETFRGADTGPDRH